MNPNAYVGISVNLHAFGPAAVRKFYQLRETGEWAYEIKALSGELLHVTPAYLAKLVHQ
jgi:hypothetical protein